MRHTNQIDHLWRTKADLIESENLFIHASNQNEAIDIITYDRKNPFHLWNAICSLEFNIYLNESDSLNDLKW